MVSRSAEPELQVPVGGTDATGTGWLGLPHRAGSLTLPLPINVVWLGAQSAGASCRF